ncbi:MAG TPA: NAD(P)-dependent oxidoreductase [Oculatellaceae cyanobacterium]|jgi:3-hydroxyisobutyrate dehydrogenase
MTVSIGFVGVGRMGANMARRLKDCGFKIAAVYDSNRSAAQALAEELQTTAPERLADVTRLSDVIITVVSDDQAMREIYHRDGDNLFMDAAGKTFVNCATITPSVHVELKRDADAMGAKMLECPMASSITQAREGTLYLMCAGEREVYEQLQPVLKALSSTAIFVGPPGSAAQLKALVNMVMNINTAALAEGLGLADALGLDLTLVRQVFSQTGANSRVLETDGEDMQQREHSTYFSAAHAAKDSGIALALGREQGLPMVLAEATKNQYDEMVRCGLGELDKSGISELTFKSRRPDPAHCAG